jgi:hypothetical protein
MGQPRQYTPIIQQQPLFSPLVQPAVFPQAQRQFVQPVLPIPTPQVNAFTFEQQMALLDRQMQLEERRSLSSRTPVPQEFNSLRNLPKLPAPGLFDGNEKGIPTFISSVQVYFNTIAQVGPAPPEHWKVSFTGGLLTDEYVCTQVLLIVRGARWYTSCITEDVNSFPTLDVFLEKMKAHFGDVNTPETNFLGLIRNVTPSGNIGKYNIDFANTMALALKVFPKTRSINRRIWIRYTW